MRQIVKQLDPDSVKLRKRRRLHRRRYVADGPNFVWHLDETIWFQYIYMVV